MSLPTYPALDQRFAVEGLHEDRTSVIAIVRPLEGSALCPHCHQPSVHVHSRYVRRIQDLPITGKMVHLHVHTRRFHCHTATCPQRIFSEQFAGFAEHSARRTVRLRAALRQIGFAVGGEVGARLARYLGIPVSPATLLRLMRTASVPIASPRILGMDDFAWRRGSRYGTLLYDVERRCPLALLPDRSGQTFATWLRAHPSVQLITRDRGGAYAEGARLGAPRAKQVADRWHLLCNLGEAVERFLVRERVHLPPPPALPLPTRPRPIPTARQAEAQARREQREKRFTRVHTLLERGMSLHAIAHEVGLCRNTVRCYARTVVCPGGAPRRQQMSRLDPFRDEVLRRWESGCHNGHQIYRELVALGYCGGRSVVSDVVAQLRRGLPTRLTLPSQPRTPRQLRWLLVRPAAMLGAQDHKHLARLTAEHERVGLLYELVQAFVALVHEHDLDHLELWVERAKRSGIAELRAFAQGIERDYPAVARALTLPYSQGPVEGQITKLKLLKRMMYGRAKLDLLQQRLLHPV